MKYFGTDGIRGEINKDLNDKVINRVAKAIVLYYKVHKLKPVLLIGNDTRASSGYILTKLGNVLLTNGIQIEDLGVCSSPCLAYTTQKFIYPLGLMLSASHNPAEYNGLKFFNSSGEKVSDEFEKEFETLMDKKVNLPNKTFATIKNVECLKEIYISHLKDFKRFNFPILLDCANGGTSEICSAVFPNQEKINIRPTGTNINLNAGCTHLEMLKALCIKKQIIGFAFDGDGDRIHVVDKDGSIIAGDKILYILSKFYQFSGDVCVGTIYTNLGLEKALNNRKITLQRSDVGDKNVYALMKKNNSILGGEDSGHIILSKHMNTGDGVLIAIILANIIELSGMSLKELLKDYTEHIQLRKNIKVTNKSIVNDILNNVEIINLIKQFEELGTKIIIRPSGTEPVIRLFAEHKDINTATKAINTVYQAILTMVNKE